MPALNNASWFRSIADACDWIEEWKCQYNEDQPHSAFSNLTPNALAGQAPKLEKLPSSQTTTGSIPYRSIQHDRPAYIMLRRHPHFGNMSIRCKNTF
ncbi:MAG: integrase core domain-containing protein [Limisphaerales bacterium]